MSGTMERGSVYLPTDVITALRERLRQTEGADIANAPLPMLMRFIAAQFAGLSREQAARLARPLPRGNTWTHDSYARITRAETE